MGFLNSFVEKQKNCCKKKVQNISPTSSRNLKKGCFINLKDFLSKDIKTYLAFLFTLSSYYVWKKTICLNLCIFLVYSLRGFPLFAFFHIPRCALSGLTSTSWQRGLGFRTLRVEKRLKTPLHAICFFSSNLQNALYLDLFYLAKSSFDYCTQTHTHSHTCTRCRLFSSSWAQSQQLSFAAPISVEHTSNMWL